MCSAPKLQVTNISLVLNLYSYHEKKKKKRSLGTNIIITFMSLLAQAEESEAVNYPHTKSGILCRTCG